MTPAVLRREVLLALRVDAPQLCGTSEMQSLEAFVSELGDEQIRPLAEAIRNVDISAEQVVAAYVAANGPTD